MSAHHEMMIGQPPDAHVLRRTAYPIEIDTPHTKEELEVLRRIAPHMVAVGTENIVLSQPGNHAAGIIGGFPDNQGQFIFCATHSVGQGTHIYHPYSNIVVDLSRERATRFYPDTTCVEWIPQYGQIDEGIQLRPYLPGPCWIASMRYGGNHSFHLQIATHSTTISGTYSRDKHNTFCPVIDGDGESIGPGWSGSAVIQRLAGEGYGLVGVLHGLSIDNRIMFSPIPRVLLSKYPREHGRVTTTMVR